MCDGTRNSVAGRERTSFRLQLQCGGVWRVGLNIFGGCGKGGGGGGVVVGWGK
jgi:hypothetical protein